MLLRSLARLLFLCSIVAMSSVALAQASRPGQETRRCKMVESCNVPPPIRDCALQTDTRSCMRNVVPFNIQINDPVCEAAKEAQNQTYQVAKVACEFQKAADRAENEWKRQRCLSFANVCTIMLPVAASTKFSGAKLLWVDDHPDNNSYERQALTELGAIIVTAEDTNQAITQLSKQQVRFDVVISDFERTGDARAGYTLLTMVRKLPDPVPIIIYSGSSTPTFVAEAIKRGAFGQTNEPKELMTLVIRAAVVHRRKALKPGSPK